ncbi:MAG: hypothetical protein H7841_17580 [Magnetospirillum sp. WYHS-4]
MTVPVQRALADLYLQMLASLLPPGDGKAATYFRTVVGRSRPAANFPHLSRMLSCR